MLFLSLMHATCHAWHDPRIIAYMANQSQSMPHNPQLWLLVFRDSNRVDRLHVSAHLQTVRIHAHESLARSVASGWGGLTAAGSRDVATDAKSSFLRGLVEARDGNGRARRPRGLET